ncbi:T9SS type A sorting domain-containing protein [Bacteroidota bacterium]
MRNVVLLIAVLLFSNELIAQDFWTLTDGPYGAIINSVCEAPNGNLLAGTDNGLFYSTNEGNSWEIMGFFGLIIHSVTVADSGKIYLAIGGDLQLSTDSGTSWRSIDGGLDGADFKIIHPGINGKLYAIAHISHQYNKLFEANNDDGGWSQLPTNMYLIQAFDIKPSNGYFFFGTFGEGIYRSTDNGENIVNVGLDTMTIRTFMIDSSGNIYAGTMYHGIYLSSDDGDNWTHIGLEGYSIYSISKNSNNDLICGTWYNGVYRSTDNGNTWTQHNNNLINKTILSIYTNDNDKVFIGSNGDAVFSTTDNGNNWEYSSDGFKASDVRALAANNTGRIFAATVGAGMWYTDDKGNSWNRINNGLDTPSFSKLKINSQGHIFTGSSWGAIFRSTDNGSSWTKLRDDVASAQLGDLYIDYNDNIYIGITNNGVYKSTNNGDDWTDIGLNDIVQRSIIVKNDTIILVGTYSNGLLRSTDNGETWTNPNTSASTIYALEIDKNGNIYSGGYQGQLEKSTNDGESWSLMYNHIHQINDILISSDDQIFLTLDGDGVRLSIDGGNNWEIVNTGLKSKRIHNLIFDIDQDLFAALVEGVYTSSDLFVDLDSPVLINPKDDATAVNLIPIFSWNEVENATEYQFQLSDTEDFSNELDFSTTPNTYTNADYSFDYSTKYYWRVRSKQNISVSNWSESWSFTTTIESAVLVSPEQNSVDIETPVSFSWHQVYGASSYTLLISENSDFSTTFSRNDVILDTTFVKSGLDSYTDYYWKIRVIGLGSTSEWSETWKFTTTLAAPMLFAPENDLSGLEPIVECTWEVVPYASNYIIELATEPDFLISAVIYNGEPSSTNSHTFSIEYGTKYYWHVKSKTSGSESVWSETRNFSTGFAGPVLTAPENDFFDLPIPLTFTWENYDDAEEYYLEISTDENFSDIVYFDSNIDETEWIVDEIEYNTTYYWRLKALVEDIYSFWSETRSFTTGIMPPVLTAPTNGDDSFVNPFVIKWNYSGNASGYCIEISKDANFEKIEITDSSMTEKQYTANQLEFIETYFWRVKAKVDGRYSLWSESWSFTTVLDKPELSAPINLADDQEISLELEWLPVFGSEYYELQVSENSQFTFIIFTKDSIYDTSMEVENLSYDKKYYWQIRAKNEKGASQWSEFWDFTTKEEPNGIDEFLSSHSIVIYPNPCNNKVSFNLELKSPVIVEIAIFDLMGNHVININDGLVSTGSNIFTWKTNGSPNGTYLYLIKIDDKYTSGKISLVK